MNQRQLFETLFGAAIVSIMPAIPVLPVQDNSFGQTICLPTVMFAECPSMVMTQEQLRLYQTGQLKIQFTELSWLQL